MSAGRLAVIGAQVGALLTATALLGGRLSHFS